MSNGDFVCSSPNDGTHYFRPVTARAQTFWQKQNYNRFVVDNNEDYYIVKSENSGLICDEIRKIAINNKDVKIIFPVHPNPNIKNHVNQKLKNIMLKSFFMN